jgi:predicted HicB family RNase H-like nuclease
MKRTQVQLDEAVYRHLQRKASERGISLAALIREALRQHLMADPTWP